MDKIVAKVNDLQDGEMKEIAITDEKSILLLRVDGKFYALGSKCTHVGAPLVEGVLYQNHVRCPWHQACFDIVTGNLEEPPALDALPYYTVRVEGDDVIVSFPEELKEKRIANMVRRNKSIDSREFVILGAGGAGNIAAETLRQDGFHGRITMITKESHLPYDRTQLSKGYIKNPDSKHPILRSEDFYKDYDIEVLTNHEVTNLDPSSKTITFKGNSTIKYDKVLIATGSRPRKLSLPGVELENIFTLRSLDDADKIKSIAVNSSRVVVIGASFIGMETAAHLTERGLSVTVVAPEAYPFQALLGNDIGKAYKALHESKGVSFRLSSNVARFEGQKKVEAVILENGESLEVDFVIMGIGVSPVTDFLSGIPLNADGSVTVDKNFRISEDIYAAGDIASFIDWRTNEYIRIEHWRLAEQHGRIAAHNMIGKESEFRSIPFFWSNQLGFNLRYIGYTKGWDEIIFQGDPATRNFGAFYVKNGKILAVSGAGSDVKMPAVAELMQANLMLTIDELRQSHVDMVQKLKLR
ncbi:MAG: FAD-dependent oxidoreductase [bacterium]